MLHKPFCSKKIQRQIHWLVNSWLNPLFITIMLCIMINIISAVSQTLWIRVNMLGIWIYLWKQKWASKQTRASSGKHRQGRWWGEGHTRGWGVLAGWQVAKVTVLKLCQASQSIGLVGLGLVARTSRGGISPWGWGVVATPSGPSTPRVSPAPLVCVREVVGQTLSGLVASATHCKSKPTFPAARTSLNRLP